MRGVRYGKEEGSQEEEVEEEIKFGAVSPISYFSFWTKLRKALSASGNQIGFTDPIKN